MTMKMIAERSGVPTLEMALLIAEAIPELWTGTEPMSVVVSGATTSEIPSPNRRIEGRMSVCVETGGMRLAGSSKRAIQGVLVTGTRAYHRSPIAMRIGPAAR